jgi:hypothetical protein
MLRDYLSAILLDNSIVTMLSALTTLLSCQVICSCRLQKLDISFARNVNSTALLVPK